VLADVVDASDIVESHLAITVDIKFLVGLPNEAASVVVEIAAESHEEFIEVDRA